MKRNPARDGLALRYKRPVRALHSPHRLPLVTGLRAWSFNCRVDAGVGQSGQGGGVDGHQSSPVTRTHHHFCVGRRARVAIRPPAALGGDELERIQVGRFAAGPGAGLAATPAVAAHAGGRVQAGSRTQQGSGQRCRHTSRAAGRTCSRSRRRSRRRSGSFPR